MIESSFDALAGGGEAITIDSLRAALSSSDAEVRDAAAFLVENDSLRFALDVGNGDGQIDGEISRDDVGVFADALAREDIGELLADTAGGEGGAERHEGAHRGGEGDQGDGGFEVHTHSHIWAYYRIETDPASTLWSSRSTTVRCRLYSRN